jgi:hypothetical protein
MSKQKMNVGIVGLGFGREFIPIYQSIPMAVRAQSAPAIRKT